MRPGALRSEREKMRAGEPYDAMDPELVALRGRARRLCRALDDTRDDPAARQRILAELIAAQGERVTVEPPFLCDYGFNIALGARSFVNFNCVLLDVAPIDIGAHVLLGPGVQIYAATHPLDAAARREVEYGEPVRIGDDAWIGGGAIVCPGVTIGARSVIGAGSIVVRDIPEDVLAVGNPCRVVRSLR